MACLSDPTFSRFSRTPTCDRQTDRHMTTAYTTLAWRRAVKMAHVHMCVCVCVCVKTMQTIRAVAAKAVVIF